MNKHFIYGKPYFQLHFLDKNFEYPIINSLVFIGKNLEGTQDVTSWFFQDAESYLEYGPYSGAGIEVPANSNSNEKSVGEVYSFPETQLDDVITVEELIDELQSWQNGSYGKPK